MGRRRVGSRRVKMNGVHRETGFSTNAAEATAMSQLAGVEREIASQDAKTNAALERSNKAREKIVGDGLFGGLIG